MILSNRKRRKISPLEFQKETKILNLLSVLPASMIAQLQETQVRLWVIKVPWRRKWLPILGFHLGNPIAEESGRLQSRGSQRVRHD